MNQLHTADFLKFYFAYITALFSSVVHISVRNVIQVNM